MSQLTSNLDMSSINDKTDKAFKRHKIAAEHKRLIDELMAREELSHEVRNAISNLKTFMEEITNLDQQ